MKKNVEIKQNTKIKILHVVCGLRSGGVEQMLINYCSQMDKNKFEFDVAYQHTPVPTCLKKIETAGCKTYQIPSKVRHPFKNFKNTYSLIKENHYDIVHSHMNLMNFIPLLCASLCGVKVRISHSHIAEQGKNIIYRSFALVCKLMIKCFATDYFACGEDAAIYMYGKKAFDTGKVTIVRNAINTKDFVYNNQIRMDIRNEFHTQDKFIVGHIGRFSEQKNHMFLIDIFKEVYNKNSNAVLFLIGTGELEQKVRDRVKNLGLESSVLFLGVRADVNCIYQAMDIFVLPSLYEGLPVVGIEAQAAGLHCLFSDTVSKGVKITDLVDFLSIDQKSEEWADKILYLANDLVKLDTFQQIQKAGYDIRTESGKLAKFYFQLISKISV